MFGTLKGRLLIVLAVLAVSGFYLWKNGLKQGLDLQGGMHLVLEISDPDGTMTPEARADATDRALKIIRTRIDEFGVQEPIVQKSGSDRIIVELAGLRDEGRAKDVIQKTAFLEWKLLKRGTAFRDVLPRLDRAVTDAVGVENLSAAAAADTAPRQDDVRSLLFRQDTGSAAADTAGGDTAAAPLNTVRPFTSLLAEASEGEYLVAQQDVERVNRYLALPEVRRLLPRDVSLHWSAEPEGRGAELFRRLFVLEKDAFITGEMLEEAVAGRDQQFGQTIVSFELSRRGGRIFERITSQHMGERLAIVLDNQVYSAPVIQARIGSRGEIQMGQSPLSEAQDLALVLRAGALPAPLEVIEERTVGPSLGADSITQGRIAGIVGVALIVLIMLGIYKVSGFLAIVALGVYVVLVMGGLAGFNAKLSAPGIAGLILSVGMAVDGNVLVFERIREELDAGRTNFAAAETGFQNAMSAIVDSNLTTLITALILYAVGTGPVQGFAVTLSVGIVASFFSVVFVTRTLMLMYLERKRPTDPISI